MSEILDDRIKKDFMACSLKHIDSILNTIKDIDRMKIINIENLTVKMVAESELFADKISKLHIEFCNKLFKIADDELASAVKGMAL